VLLFSDDPIVLDTFKSLSQAERLELLLPDTGDETLARARQDAPDMVVVDLAVKVADGWNVYQRLRGDSATSIIPVLLIAREEDLSDRLGTLRPDMDDYVTRPLRANETAHRMRHLLARAQFPAGRSQEARQTGRIIAFCSNKGGVGKTVLAVNLAVALRQRTGKRVAVVDGDFYYGNVGTYLGVPPARSIMDLVTVIDELDAEVADRVLIRHASGIRVLLSPLRPDQTAEIKPEHVHRILEFLSTIYDYLVVDCQTVIDNRIMPALDLATDVMLVVTPEMGCLKNMRILLDQFSDIGIDLKKVRVVLNRAASNVEIEARDIEQAFKQKIAFSLSSGGRPVVLSINRGVPLVMEQPKHPISQQIMHMADYFVLQSSPRAYGRQPVRAPLT
jgi:pilus assembly protein CpaE